MEGEASGSRRGRGRPRKPRQMISYKQIIANLSTKGKETLMIVNHQRQRRHRKQLNSIPGNSVTVFDNTCPTYNWLKDGWIAEERIIPTARRVHKYFYDLPGQLYRSPEVVNHIYAELDKNRVMIIVD